MPANQGAGTEHWHPKSDITPHHLNLEMVSFDGYIPTSAADCSNFIVNSCMVPEIEACAGLPELQQSIADEHTAAIYFEGKDILPALQRRIVRQATLERQVTHARWLEVNSPPKPVRPAQVSYINKAEIPLPKGQAQRLSSCVSA